MYQNGIEKAINFRLLLQVMKIIEKDFYVGLNN